MVPKLVEKVSGWTSTPRVARRGALMRWGSRQGRKNAMERGPHTDVLLLKLAGQVALLN
jgi:hypothetical protein